MCPPIRPYPTYGGIEAVAIASLRKTWTIDQVAGVITSGIASPTLVLVHRKSPR